jgi:hypothetical protein
MTYITSLRETADNLLTRALELDQPTWAVAAALFIVAATIEDKGFGDYELGQIAKAIRGSDNSG